MRGNIPPRQSLTTSGCSTGWTTPQTDQATSIHCSCVSGTRKVMESMMDAENPFCPKSLVDTSDLREPVLEAIAQSFNDPPELRRLRLQNAVYGSFVLKEQKKRESKTVGSSRGRLEVVGARGGRMGGSEMVPIASLILHFQFPYLPYQNALTRHFHFLHADGRLMPILSRCRPAP